MVDARMVGAGTVDAGARARNGFGMAGHCAGSARGLTSYCRRLLDLVFDAVALMRDVARRR